MRAERGAWALALALTALPALADPPLPVSPEAGLKRAFDPPRYYAFEVTGDLAMSYRMCMGLDGMQQARRAMEARMKEPAEQARRAAADCTLSRSTNPDGSTTLVSTCAKSRSRTTISGGLADQRTHTETTLIAAGPDGLDRKIVRDSHMTYLGACPATVKPGEMVSTDGRKMDMTAVAAGLERHPKP